MTDILRQHALQHVWCTPKQDHQYIIKPVRIGPAGGVVSSVIVHNEVHALPNPGITPLRRYVVFDIGPLAPWKLNLPERRHKWYSISELMNTRNLDIWLYRKTGQRLPGGLGYIKRAADNGYILVVERHPAVEWEPEFEEEELYIRFYSNAFFRTDRFINGGYNTYLGVDYISGQLGGDLSSGQLNAWITPRYQVQQASETDAKGGLYGFADGKLVWPVINSGSFPAGSYVEVVFDRSIYRSKKVFLEDLDQFASELDDEPKYLVVPWLNNTETNIEFYDDVDFYLCRGNRGVYIHRNELNSIRQLTNATYTISVQHIDAYISDNPWLDENDPTFPGLKPFILMRFRHSGYLRSLVQEHMHLQDMVKLGEDGFMNALTGSQSNVPEWRAEYIENSEYNALQRALTAERVTEEKAYGAYGYDASAKMLLPTDLNPVNPGALDTLFFDTPASFNRVTAMLFDRKGKLLRVRGVPGGNVIQSSVTPNDIDTRYQHAKLIEGQLTLNATTSSFYDMLSVSNGRPVREQGFRCYISTRVGSASNEEWRVVEENEGFWSVSSDGLSIEWDEATVIGANGYPAVRFSDHVIYTPEVQFQAEEDGVLTLDIAHSVIQFGQQVFRVEHIPYSNLLIFSEDKLLVEGIDFYVKWPQVVVVKKYAEKKVSVLCWGLCNDDLTRDSVSEAGFTYRSVLSVDERWHIRNDRNVLISVGGNVIPPDQVQGFECYWETTPPYAVSDVVPYAVIDMVQAIEPVLGEEYDTPTERGISTDIRHRIEDYMTDHMDYELPELPNVTTQKYRLYSPFISRVVAEMIDGRFDDLPSMDQLSTQQVEDLVEDFVWLVDFDPVHNDADFKNCLLLAHNYDTAVPLTLNQYMFVHRLVDIYLGGQINLSPSLTVQE